MSETQKKLTMGEIARAETLAGISITSLDDITQPKGYILAGLYTVIRQRTEPKFKYAEALEMDMEEVSAYISEHTNFFSRK